MLRSFIAAARAASDTGEGLAFFWIAISMAAAAFAIFELQSPKIARVRIFKIDVIQAHGKDPYPGKFSLGS